MLIKIMQKGGKEGQQKFLIENWKGKKKKKKHTRREHSNTDDTSGKDGDENENCDYTQSPETFGYRRIYAIETKRDRYPS